MTCCSKPVTDLARSKQLTAAAKDKATTRALRLVAQGRTAKPSKQAAKGKIDRKPCCPSATRKVHGESAKAAKTLGRL